MKLKMMVALAMAAAAILAQDKGQDKDTASGGGGEKTVLKMVELKYADPHVADALGQMGLLVQRTGRAILIRGTPDQVGAAEAILKQLDVPPAPRTNVELTLNLVVASKAAGESKPLGPELEPVVAQLRKVFAYQSWIPLDGILMRMTDDPNRGMSSAKGVLPPLVKGAAPGTYSLEMARMTVTGSAGARTIGLENFNFAIMEQEPAPGAAGGLGPAHASLMTSIDVKEGQKVVVGKAGLNGGDDAVFVVVTAKVVE
jgi:hypothetical protein